MDKACRVYYTLLALILQLKGNQATNCNKTIEHAVFTWPLGEAINQYEITTTSWAGNINNVTYKSGPSNLNYNALELNGTNKAFIEVPVLSSNDIERNYAISLYLFVVEDGVFLHYRSDDYADNATSGTLLKSMKMAMLNGNIQTTIGNGLTETVRTTSTSIAYQTWYRVILRREYSQPKVIYELTSAFGTDDFEADFDTWIQNVPMSYPGTLRFGGSLDGESFVTGRVTCAQIIPCRNARWDDGYETTCLTANWPDLTPTPTSTATPTPSTTTPTTTTTTTSITTTPTTTPITTYTTTPTTTTTTTPTTTLSTTPTTPSTTTPSTSTTTTPTTTTTSNPTTTTTTTPTASNSTPITTPTTTTTTTPTTTTTTTPTATTTTTTPTTVPTTLTTAPTTTTTTTPTASTTTPTTTTTTTPTTTFTSNTTTTPTPTTTTTTTSTTARPSSTTSATTILPTTSSTTLTSCSPPLTISLNCIRYRVAHLNATFSSGILGAFVVDAPLACSSKCSAHGTCQSYAFKFRNCILGSYSPGTVYEAGSTVYELA